MRRLQAQIRLQKWHVDEAQKKLAALLQLEENLRRDRSKLAEELPNEQAVAARGLETSLTYGVYAAQLFARRQRLDRSIEDIVAEVAQARAELRAAFGDLKKFEQAAALAEQRLRHQANRRERQQEDETALNVFRRDAAARY